MYNEERKKEYIEEREEEVIMSSQALANIFSKTQPSEEEYGIDVSEFSIAQIMDVYKRINTKSLDLLLNINTQLAHYTGWCMSRLLIPSGINNFQEVTLEMLMECVNKLAVEEGMMTREEVLDIARRMKNAREKFVILMCYETGRSKYFQNIFFAKLEDFEDGYLNTYDGRRVVVSRELYFAAVEANEEKEYNAFINMPDARSASRKRMLIDRGYIYKETDSASVDSNTRRRSRMNITMKKNFAAVGVPKWIQLKEFENSGIINMIKEIAKRENIDEKSVVWDVRLRKEVENQYGILIRSPRQFLRKFGEFLD